MPISLPLEALRVGADAFASDLNPVAVLLNKVVLEYIPKYGQRLADEVRKWGQWVKEEAEKELAEFYPKDEDGSTPIAYLWARTIISEAPDDGSGIPVEVPLMRSLWLAKKAGRNKALRWVRDDRGVVQTEVLEVTYADGVMRKVRRPLLEIFEPKSEKEVEKGTVARGSGTCPMTGYTTPVASVRKQLKERKGGANDARLFCVVLTNLSTQGRFYRLPNSKDLEANNKAITQIEKLQKENLSSVSLVPDEILPVMSGVFNAPIYGHDTWGSLFTSRQLLTLVTLVKIVKYCDSEKIDELGINKELANAIQTCLALGVSRFSDICNSLCMWESTKTQVRHLFTRQAIPMLWDFAEPNIFADAAGNYHVTLSTMIEVLKRNSIESFSSCQAEQASATANLLPDDAAQFLCTDPPYYNAVPYADLSDFFYVWMKRSLRDLYPNLFAGELSPKDEGNLQSLQNASNSRIRP